MIDRTTFSGNAASPRKNFRVSSLNVPRFIPWVGSPLRYETASPNDEAIFETGRENHVFDYEHALDVLMVCALRRRTK